MSKIMEFANQIQIPTAGAYIQFILMLWRNK